MAPDPDPVPITIISHKNSPASMNVIICFVCYINTVTRLAYRTSFLCHSGVSVGLCLIKIMLLGPTLVWYLIALGPAYRPHGDCDDEILAES